MRTVAFVSETPTPSSRNRLALARVAAAGRLTDARRAQDEKARKQTLRDEQFRQEIRVLAAKVGATGVNLKICFADGGKLRLSVNLEEGLSWVENSRSRGDDVEACLVDDEGEWPLDTEGSPFYI